MEEEKKFPPNYRRNKTFEKMLRDMFDDNGSCPVTIVLMDRTVMQIKIYSN